MKRQPFKLGARSANGEATYGYYINSNVRTSWHKRASVRAIKTLNFCS